jgi:hypothetical protein
MPFLRIVILLKRFVCVSPFFAKPVSTFAGHSVSSSNGTGLPAKDTTPRPVNDGRSRHIFCSIARIAQASVQELTPFVGAKVAEVTAEHFRKQKKFSRR